MNKLVYTEENDLRIYESLPAEDFKEFFMAYFKYKKGDSVNITDFTSPITYSLFCSYIPKLDRNEDVYNTRIANGKKGGRPRKTDSKPSNDAVEVQPQQEEEKAINALKIAIPTEFIEGLNNTTETEETTENMGTFIGYIETPTQDEKFDNFSDTLYKLIDEYESIINHTTEAIAKAELSDDVVVVYQAKQAKLKLREISENLIEEIDKTNFNKFIMERVEIKKKHIAA